MQNILYMQVVQLWQRDRMMRALLQCAKVLNFVYELAISGNESETNFCFTFENSRRAEASRRVMCM